MGKKKKKSSTNTKNLPFVSVCTPTFNRRPFIPIMLKCFNSQTYPKDNIEWIIIDDGTDKIEDLVKDHPNVKYYKYDENLQEELINLRNLKLNEKDLKKYSDKLKNLERKITLFHADKINRIIAKYRNGIDLIGFHGQTIFHNSEKKISKQLGDGRLLSQLLKKKVIYDFRQDDMKNNGQGAPLTPVFHYLLSKIINKKFKTKLPMVIINIGGITNVTKIIIFSCILFTGNL